MSARVARFYLYPDLQRRVAAGRHGLLCPWITLLKDAGFAVEIHDDAPQTLEQGGACGGYSVVRMTEPLGPMGVSFRKTYVEPFYHIEQCARRHDWPVAQAAFDADMPPAKAARFMANLRGRLFGDRPVTRGGYIYVPLQGRLLDQRSFQSMTPMAMIESVLAHDPARRVVAGLHPGETYGPEEQAALAELDAREARFSLSPAPSKDLLLGCDYVATMTSSVALHGYVIEKPAVLFGQIDFHHIALETRTLGAAKALSLAPDHRPDFAAYLWWFFRVMAIRAKGDDAARGIRSALKSAGWPID